MKPRYWRMTLLVKDQPQAMENYLPAASISNSVVSHDLTAGITVTVERTEDVAICQNCKKPRGIDDSGPINYCDECWSKLQYKENS